MSQHIQNKIKMLRFMSQEMTQEDLANKTHVTRQTIAAIENNKYSPSLELAFKISDAYELPICKVFSYGTSDRFQNIHEERGKNME